MSLFLKTCLNIGRTRSNLIDPTGSAGPDETPKLTKRSKETFVSNKSVIQSR